VETLAGFAIVGVFICAYLVAWGFDLIAYLWKYRVYHMPTALKDLGPTIIDRYTFNVYPAMIPLATLGLSRTIALVQGRSRLSIPQNQIAIIIVLLWAFHDSQASLTTFGVGYLTLRS